jgi:hypothetical protein
MVWARLEGSNALERILGRNMGILRGIFADPGLSPGHDTAGCQV